MNSSISAPWCAPCRRIAPIVDQLAEEYNGRLTVAKVDIDENPMTPSKFMVRGIPTLLLFKNGDLKETVVGLETKDRLADHQQTPVTALETPSGHHHRLQPAGTHRRAVCGASQSENRS